MEKVGSKQTPPPRIDECNICRNIGIAAATISSVALLIIGSLACSQTFVNMPQWGGAILIAGGLFPAFAWLLSQKKSS